MTKIIIDARESGTGTGRYVDKLIEYLSTVQLQEELIIITKAERLEFIKATAPTFTVVETSFKEFTLGEQLGFMRQIRNLKPDLVHFPMVQQPVWYRGKVVTTMMDLTTVRFRNPVKNPAVFFIKQQVYKWVNRRVAKKSEHIITISEFSKQDIAQFTRVNPDKITVTYPATDPITDTPAALSPVRDEQFIMYIGRPLPHKNLPRLLEAFKELQATHPNLKLVLAGKKDALYQNIERAVRERGIKGVVFTGFVSEGQLRWLYENCQAYVFPSLSEGFGLPGLEAMAHGAPVVSSNATCLPEIYGEAAHYFDPLDTNAMASAIGEVLDNSELRQKLIAAGKARVKNFSWQRMAEQTLNIYKEALSKNNRFKF